ncbi:FxsA family protein [Cereibacter sphaeroides]|uniref:FxsA family protein n=1 Tax=Cereibacter sphaeroides TaxID=1063 RepID=UPI001F159683|nr:FxsA family protein [Cereibacter sphaeroides]MCE6952293.1 FxsA family protein [Cereibacter sphaeroides]
MWPVAVLFALPIVEIALFVTIGGAIGLLATMLVIFGTAALGVYLLRRQGVEMQSALQMSRRLDPLVLLADGAVVSVAALLLILPGFLTDTLGLLLLIPPLRRALIRRLGRNVQVHATTWRGPVADDRPIEAEYYEVDPEPRDSLNPPGRSGWTRH